MIEKRLKQYINEKQNTEQLTHTIDVWNKNYNNVFAYNKIKDSIGNAAEDNESVLIVDMTYFAKRHENSLDNFLEKHSNATLVLLVYEDAKVLETATGLLAKHCDVSLDHFLTCNNGAGNYRAIIYKHKLKKEMETNG